MISLRQRQDKWKKNEGVVVLMQGERRVEEEKRKRDNRSGVLYVQGKKNKKPKDGMQMQMEMQVKYGCVCVKRDLSSSVTKPYQSGVFDAKRVSAS